MCSQKFHNLETGIEVSVYRGRVMLMKLEGEVMKEARLCSGWQAHFCMKKVLGVTWMISQARIARAEINNKYGLVHFKSGQDWAGARAPLHTITLFALFYIRNCRGDFVYVLVKHQVRICTCTCT